MAREVTPPPAVARSRDIPMMVTALIALAACIAGIITMVYGHHMFDAIILFLVSALGCLAAGLRLVKERKKITTGDLEGEDNSHE